MSELIITTGKSQSVQCTVYAAVLRKVVIQFSIKAYVTMLKGIFIGSGSSQLLGRRSQCYSAMAGESTNLCLR